MAQARAVDRSGSGSGDPRTGYRAHLDGIRAFAVAMVFLFHADVARLSGGFVGVDVFFVLSGYLVTGVLLQACRREGGVPFRRFYSRRVRRLLPLALLVLVVAAVFFAVLAAPIVVSDARGSFVAASLYVANWWFIAETTEYLGSNLDENPILHYWSLSIEEQFYVVWPLVVHATFRLGKWLTRHPERVLGALAVAAGTASLVAALWIGAGDVDRAYFGSDTRAYQLLLGAALVISPPLRLPAALARWGAAASLGLLGLLATDALTLSPITRGASAAAATAVLLVGVDTGTPGAVRRWFASGPMVWLGMASYAIYLWHLPVFFVLDHQVDTTPLLRILVAAAITLALAGLSGWLLENPVRRSDALSRVPRGVIAAGLGASLVTAVVLASTVLTPSTEVTVEATRVTAQPAESGPSPAGSSNEIGSAPASTPTSGSLVVDLEEVKKDRGSVPECQASDPSECTVVVGSGVHVLLVGDSHARVWAPAFEQLALKADYTLSIASFPACSWHWDAMVAFDADRVAECFDRQGEWFEVVFPALQPDVVVFVQRATFDPALPFMAAYDDYVMGAERSVAAARAFGAAVVIIDPTPVTAKERDPLTCLSAGRPAEECGFDASPGGTQLEPFYDELAAADAAVLSVDLDALACPSLPRCDLVVDGTIVWRDHTHMTATYATSLGDQLAALGLIDTAAALPR